MKKGVSLENIVQTPPRYNSSNSAMNFIPSTSLGSFILLWDPIHNPIKLSNQGHSLAHGFRQCLSIILGKEH